MTKGFWASTGKVPIAGAREIDQPSHRIHVADSNGRHDEIFRSRAHAIILMKDAASPRPGIPSPENW